MSGRERERESGADCGLAGISDGRFHFLLYQRDSCLLGLLLNDNEYAKSVCWMFLERKKNESKRKNHYHKQK